MPTLDKLLLGALLVVESYYVLMACLSSFGIHLPLGLISIFFIIIFSYVRAWYLGILITLIVLFLIRLFQRKITSIVDRVAYAFLSLQIGAFWITDNLALKFVNESGPGGYQHSEVWMYLPMLLVVILAWWAFITLNLSRGHGQTPAKS